jgi:hypothetical protein
VVQLARLRYGQSDQAGKSDGQQRFKSTEDDEVDVPADQPARYYSSLDDRSPGLPQLT